MPVEHKTFNGGLNADDSDFSIGPNQYRNAINARILTSENGTVNSVENIRGNTPVGDTTELRDGENRVISTHEDETNGDLFFFVYNSNGGHYIKKYNKGSDTTTIILDNNLFVKDGVNKGLAFRRDKFVTGIAKIGDMLFWANGIPRRINVKRIQDGQYTSFDDDLINMIRRPPNLPPTWAKITTGDTGMVSMINDNAFQFAWRFVYYDGETSVFSPYSTMAPYGADNDKNDTINVILPSDVTIKQDVRFVELAVRYGNTGDLFVIKRWDKDDDADGEAIAAHNDGNSLAYNFMNDRIGEAVSENDAAKPFENIPFESESLEAADNRIFLGDNTMGYDTPSKTSLSVSTQSTTVDVGSEIIKAAWWWGAENYHSGFPGNKYSHTSWFLYLSGVEGKDDGYYGVDGVDYSKYGSHINTNDNTKAPDSAFSFPDPVNYSDLQWIGTTDTSIMKFYGLKNEGTRHFNKGKTGHTDTTIVGAPTQNDFKATKIFKTATTYQVGIVFYDRYLRACSVVSIDSDKVRIPETSYSNQNFINKIVWGLSNSNALTEIPDWAEYYSIVMTNNLRTRFFMQTYPYEISYVNKTDEGTYETKKEAYDPSFAGIQIDISSLSKDNLGYVYNKGDIVDLYIEGKGALSLSVIDQYGKYIVCNLVDIGDTTDTPNALMEIYTPYKASTVEPFWEVGQMYAINNPGTGSREYSTLTGVIEGDTWIIARKFSAVSTNGVEAMSPNDKYYQNWWTDAGRPNVTPQPGIGHAEKETDIAFSNQYIPGTLVNGLCSFDTLNFKSLPDSCGPIRKLIYTSKVQGNLGGVLLAICENETVSIYIGETQVQTQTGDSFLAASPGVIGTINVLRGGYGTINPESVVEKSGNVYFIDVKHSRVIRYSVNGLFPISDYKMKTFFNDRCKALQGLSANDIETLGMDMVYCCGGFDDRNAEYLVYMPRVKELPDFLEDIIRGTYKFSLNFVTDTPLSTPDTELNKFKFYSGEIKTSLASGTATLKYGETVLLDNVTFSSSRISIPTFKPAASGKKFTLTLSSGTADITINELQPNYHEIDDGQSKVLAFKEGVNEWQGGYMCEPEYFGVIGNTLYAAKNGRIYAHGGHAEYNTFFGEKFPSMVAIVSNENPISPRIFNGITVDASQRPDYVHLRTEVAWDEGRYHQSTDLVKGDYEIDEGRFYASFYYDRLSPNAMGDTPEARMKNGDVMRAQTGKVLIEFDEFEKPIEIKTVGIHYTGSTGHIV